VTTELRPDELAAVLADSREENGGTAPPELVLAASLALKQELWRRGRAAEYLLDTAGPTGGQQAWCRMLDAIPPGSWAALEVSRQRGKTFTILAWATQRLGLSSLSAVFLAQTGANAEAIVRQFLKDVGDELPPEWDVRFVDGVVRFANASELAVFGTDNQQYRRSRGRKAHLVLLSEAAFYPDLADVEQVYQPQLQTTGGVGVYESSPALNPGHDFSRRCDAAAAVGRYVRDTFWSNPRIDHEAVIRGEMERLGLTREQLLQSTAFRREYLAERVTEETRAALPAWTDEAAAELVRVLERPAHFDAYVAMDPGHTGDPHATLFGYHDPSHNRLVIEDELELRSAVTHIGAWAAEVKAKESQLWGVNKWEGTLSGATHEHLKKHNLDDLFLRTHSATAPRQPWLRVSDVDARVTVDMALQHGIAVLPSEKHDKALWVDTVNQLIRERRVYIHPRCVRLLEQMRSTLWNRTRSQWERTDKDHGDLIDDLVFMCRAVRWHRDCRPPPMVDRGLQLAMAAMKGPGPDFGLMVGRRRR